MIVRFLHILLLALSHASYSQTPFTELILPKLTKDIKGMMVDTDIFLSIDATGDAARTSNKSYFIHPDGTMNEVDLDAITDKQMIGGTRQGDSTYFYYLEEIRGRVGVRSMVVHNRSGKGNVLPHAIGVPGKIYGSYVENGDLYILCALKKEFSLRMLHFQKGNIKSATDFPLSFDLGKKKEGIVSFFETKYPITPRQAGAIIKLVKDKNFIWITIDEPLALYAEITASSIYKTTVIKLDLAKGTSAIKAFFEPATYSFTSAMLNGDLYRLVQDPNGPRIDMFNFESGKKVGTATLRRGEEPGRDSTYARIGGRFKTEKDVKGAYIIKRVFGSLLVVDSLSNAEQMLTVGHYGDHMITFVGVGSVASLIMSVTSLVISDIVEGPISTVYSYYSGSIDKGFTATYHTPFLRQIIDDYEYKLLVNRVRFDYRGYLYQPGVTYAIYQRQNSKKLEILKFEK